MESNLKCYGDMISKIRLQMKKNLYDVIMKLEFFFN
jgi:hypothetical protein